ncbi:hypothetical protein [Maridesulfovibrio bastinii]|nr:hypothetical protein [Maridesulfovibrio bastinii]
MEASKKKMTSGEPRRLRLPEDLAGNFRQTEFMDQLAACRLVIPV